MLSSLSCGEKNSAQRVISSPTIIITFECIFELVSLYLDCFRVVSVVSTVCWPLCLLWYLNLPYFVFRLESLGTILLYYCILILLFYLPFFRTVHTKMMFCCFLRKPSLSQSHFNRIRKFSCNICSFTWIVVDKKYRYATRARVYSHSLKFMIKICLFFSIKSRYLAKMLYLGHAGEKDNK